MDSLTLTDVARQFLGLIQIEKLGIPADALEAGIREIGADLMRVGLDAHLAIQEGTPFASAVDDGERFPSLRRFHLGISDILQLELPEPMVGWMRELIASPAPIIATDVINALARRALEPTAPSVERALCQFLLFEGARFHLVLAALQSGEEVTSVGARLSDLDVTAEQELRWLIEHARELGPEDRPLHVLVALALKSFSSHVDALRHGMAQLRSDLEVAQFEENVRAARLEHELAQMPLTEAVLVKNKFAPVLGEQRLPLDLLQKEHPVALGGMSRPAMDQRVKRATDSLAAGGMLPQRKRMALLDIIGEQLETVGGDGHEG